MGKKRNRTKAVAQPPRDPKVALKEECARAVNVLKRGNHAKALRLMRDILRKHGDSALAHRVQATMHSFMEGVIENATVKQKHATSAIEFSKRATELAPNSMEFGHFHALMLFEHKAENEGYKSVLAECERALSIENPIDPVEEYLALNEDMTAEMREERISEVQAELKILIQKCYPASISIETETLNEEKSSLEHCAPTSRTAPLLGSNNEINEASKTLDERRKEIEVRVAAARLLQQQGADPGHSLSTSSSGPHNEKHSPVTAAASSSSSSEKEKNNLITVHSSNEQVEYSVAATRLLQQPRSDLGQSPSTTSFGPHNEEECSPAAPAESLSSSEEKNNLIPVHSCNEQVECTAAAARLLQQQSADPGHSLPTSSTGPHNEEEPSPAAAAVSSFSSEEEKNHLIPVHSSNEQVEYSARKGPSAPLPRKYSVIKNSSKTFGELRKEIEESDSAARLLQQQCGDPDQSAASSASPSPLSGFNKLVSCNVVNSSPANHMNQVQAYWNSMTAKRQFSLLRVSIPEMKSHYTRLKEVAVLDFLSEALSFAQDSGSWEFWICFKCNKKFSDAASHLNHVCAHMGMMSDLAKEAIPEEINSDWVGMLTNSSLKPIDVESVIRSSDEASNVNGNLLKDTDSGNSDYASQVNFLETEIKENRDYNGFEKLDYVVSDGDNAGGRLHKWPLSDDPEREELLEKIKSLFDLMIKHQCLSTRHVRKLLEFANDKIKTYPLPSSVLDICGEELERTPLGLCFLDASMLQVVLTFLQELSHTGGLQRSAEKDFSAVDADGATKNGVDLETLKLDLKSSTLTVEGAEGERGLRDANALFQWLYAGPSIADRLAAWACSKEEKSNPVLKLVQTLQKELSLCQTLCERRLQFLEILHMLENLREENGSGCDEFLDRRHALINDVVSTMKDNLNAKLNKLDVRIMRGVAGLHLLKLKLGSASLFDYRFVLIPLIKSFVQTRLEELVNKDKSDAAREALLAELAKKDKSWKGEAKQSNEISKDKKKGRDYRISKSPKGLSMGTVIHEERAEKSEVPLSDDTDGITTDEALNQDEEETKRKVEIEADKRKLGEFLEYRKRLQMTLEYLEEITETQQHDLKSESKAVIGIYRDDPWG